MTILEELRTCKIDDIPGIMGDWSDVNCDVKEVEGGYDVYFGKDDDEFEIGDTPTVRVFGDQGDLAYYLFSSVGFVRLLDAVQMTLHNNESLKDHWGTLYSILSSYYNEEWTLNHLGLEKDERGHITRKTG